MSKHCLSFSGSRRAGARGVVVRGFAAVVVSGRVASGCVSPALALPGDRRAVPAVRGRSWSTAACRRVGA